MHKLKTTLFFLLICPIIAGFYGVLHDQITYSISPEYYTNFKFIQFRFIHQVEARLEPVRVWVGVVGWMATWWVGIPIGLIIGGFGFWKQLPDHYRKIKFKSLYYVFLTALFVSCLGYFAGLLLTHYMGDWATTIDGSYPNDTITEGIAQVKDWNNFFIVGTIHTFSYIGGLIGVVVACIFQYRKFKEL